MIRPEFIIEELRKNMPDADFDMVWRAYAFAAKCHKGQKRVSGEAYLNHPLEVANILAKMKLGHISISVGLLHDTLEDTFATEDEIKEKFGDEVFQIVDGVTKISMIETSNKEHQQSENIRKMILAMAKDIRVILVKLADRVHNVRTLHYLKPAKQKKIAQETLDIYAPLANRLGIGWIKTELENNSFKYLWPNEYSEIKHKLAALELERDKYIDQIVEQISERLRLDGVAADVKGRPKHYYSIFSKMRSQNISFEEVYDIMGIRVITPTDQECYAILGILHSMFKPIPGKLKDYIALPKANMYQSLHTTVVGSGGKPVEVQIRSQRMDVLCEEGIASHWRYKEGGDKKSDRHDEQITWIRRLLEWQQEVKDPREFLEKVKIDLFPDEVYIFTPRQEVKSFPRGATPIDFAFSVHSDVGERCIGAKVNGKLVSLKTQLRNGDIVEILTSTQARPSRDWLKHVKTSKARTKISSYLNQAERQRALNLGRELLVGELEKYNLSPGDYMEESKLAAGARSVGYNTGDSMVVALGLGKLKLSAVFARLVPKEAITEPEVTPESIVSPTTVKRNSAQMGVKVSDIDDILIRFAQCCNPLPGDDIVGFISRGRGLIVHTKDCANSTNMGSDSDRCVDVVWDKKTSGKREAMLLVKTEDRPGTLANVSVAIADNGANITEANVLTAKGGNGHIYLTVEISDLSQLQRIMGAVMRLSGVHSVERIRNLRSFSAQMRKSKKKH